MKRKMRRVRDVFEDDENALLETHVLDVFDDYGNPSLETDVSMYEKDVTMEILHDRDMYFFVHPDAGIFAWIHIKELRPEVPLKWVTLSGDRVGKMMPMDATKKWGRTVTVAGTSVHMQAGYPGRLTECPGAVTCVYAQFTFHYAKALFLLAYAGLTPIPVMDCFRAIFMDYYDWRGTWGSKVLDHSEMATGCFFSYGMATVNLTWDREEIQMAIVRPILSKGPKFIPTVTYAYNMVDVRIAEPLPAYVHGDNDVARELCQLCVGTALTDPSAPWDASWERL